MTVAVQDEVRWVLRTIKAEWPEPTWPDHLARVNQDEPENLRTGERVKTVDEEYFNSIRVSSGSVQRELFGQKPQYNVQTTIDVQVRGKSEHSDGKIEDVSEFNTLVARVQFAINTQITYPQVDPDADDLGRIEYEDTRITDEQRLSRGDKDYYRTDFTVLLTGKQDTP